MAPLSEHEQKILDELERGLREGSPGRAEPPSRTDLARQLRVGAIAFVLGFGLLITFFVTRMLLIGVAAFGAMVVGIVIMAGAGSGYAAAKTSGSRKKRANPFEEWERALRDRFRKE